MLGLGEVVEMRGQPTGLRDWGSTQTRGLGTGVILVVLGEWPWCGARGIRLGKWPD